MYTLDYFKKVEVNAILEIEDIGNFAIKAFNDDGCEFMMVVDTNYGQSRVFQYGPGIKHKFEKDEVNELPKSVMCSFKRVKFAPGKLIQLAHDFLNNPYNGITQAMIVEPEEALQDCEDIIAYMKQKHRL